MPSQKKREEKGSLKREKKSSGKEKKNVNEGPDGAFRVPMVSQYGDTPSPPSASEREFDVVKCNLLDKLFRDFEGCVRSINETIAESCAMYPESEILKKKALKWNAMKLKHLKSDEASTHDVKTHEEVEAAIDTGYTEKTPQTRFNVSGLEALNLSKRLDSVSVHGEGSEVARSAMHAKTPRPKRTIILPPTLRSPYVSRVVSLRAEREKAEETVARCIFCGVRNACNNGQLSLMRAPFESMMPGVTVHIDVISAWAVVLNYEERMRKTGTTPKLFCSSLLFMVLIVF